MGGKRTGGQTRAGAFAGIRVVEPAHITAGILGAMGVVVALCAREWKRRRGWGVGAASGHTREALAE